MERDSLPVTIAAIVSSLRVTISGSPCWLFAAGEAEPPLLLSCPTSTGVSDGETLQSLEAFLAERVVGWHGALQDIFCPPDAFGFNGGRVPVHLPSDVKTWVTRLTRHRKPHE